MILDGRQISEKRLDLVRRQVDESGLHPVLATVIVGDDPGSRMYVRMKHKACKQVHIGSVGIDLPAGSVTSDVIDAIIRLNRDPDVSGILIQLPMPEGIDTAAITASVDPGKDVDGFHPYNVGLLAQGKPQFIPCTPKGIITLLDEYRIPIAGATAVVIGRSVEVGRPLALLLLAMDATVTICHRGTRDLPSITRGAEILVSAAGKAGFVTREMVRPGSTVIDVGINYVDGRLCGDVDFGPVSEVAGAITPVPGGVGPMTIASLMENTLCAARWRLCTGVP